GASNNAAPIMQTLSYTGVTAGTANCFQVLSTPAHSATKDIKPIYGNIQRVINTAASWAWPLSKPLASSHTKMGAPATPSTHVNSNAQNSTVATFATRRRVRSSPSWVLVVASTGTKAWLKAPSANNLRKRLGIRKATLKASVSALAPNME